MWGKLKNLYRTRWQFSFAIILFMMLAFIPMEVHNHRFHMNDFHVYYTAASRIIHGENLYRPAEDGHYHYKYSPESAIYFIPLTVFNYSAAKISYWILLSLVICFGFYLSLSLVKPDFRQRAPGRINNMILLAGLILGVHIQRELHLGQVNQLLLVIFIGMAALMVRSQKALLSFLWAASIFIKPHGLIFLPYFIIKKEFKIIGYFFLFLVIIVLTPLLFYDANMAISQHQQWFTELGVELGQKEALTNPGIHTVFSLLARYTPLRLLDFTPFAKMLFQVAVLLALGTAVLYLIYRGYNIGRGFILEMAFLIGLIPLLASTGSVAFAFIELSLFLIIFNWSKLARWAKVVAVAGFVFLGGNFHDLLGSRLSLFVENISLVAAGAVMLLIVVFYMRSEKLA
jgi:hypothetical protein